LLLLSLSQPITVCRLLSIEGFLLLWLDVGK
jgi:hypothetical protein